MINLSLTQAQQSAPPSAAPSSGTEAFLLPLHLSSSWLASLKTECSGFSTNSDVNHIPPSDFMLLWFSNLWLPFCCSDFEEPIPDDRYHGIYFAMLLAGVGFLLPYNSFITDVDYLHQKFKGINMDECAQSHVCGYGSRLRCHISPLCFRDIDSVWHESDVHLSGFVGRHPQQCAGGATQHAHQDHCG